MSFVGQYFSLTGDKLRKKAFYSKSRAQTEAAANNDLAKVLGAFDLTFLGIGGIIGAGVFVLTGVAARKEAGPAVVLSYVTASISAVLSALCYTEFAVDTPVAGGAFAYVNMTFGEFVGWIAASNLILEYTLSSAAVARSFSSYAATTFGADPNTLRIAVGSSGVFMLDIPAAAVVCALCALLAAGTRGGARFNTAVTIVNLVVIAFVLAAGLPRFKAANFTPFLPFGFHGVFSGASKVFFSFIGFDTVATAAEETRNPAFDLPMGIVASLVICSGLYVAMCVTICGMVSYDAIDVNAPFATAFVNVDMAWASYIVSVGAVAGILTSLLVTLLGQARVWMTLGRERLVPRWLAHVDDRFHTPTHATLVTACTAGLFALLVDLEALADLVSIGTLSVFFLVSLACVWRRYHIPHDPVRPWLLAKVAAQVALGLALSISYTARAPAAVTIVFAALWAAAVGTLLTEDVAFRPPRFQVPLSPLVPSLAVLANVFLITSLGYWAYVRFAVWFVLSLAVYVFYGVHHSQEYALEPVTRSGNGAADGDVFIESEHFMNDLELARHSPGTTTPRRAKSPPAAAAAGLGPALLSAAALRSDDVELSES